MPRITENDIGNVWTPQATFKVGTVNTDPTTITVRRKTPSGVETVLANAVSVAGLTSTSTPVAKTAVGVLKPNPGITLTEAGYWIVRFEGTGTATGAQEHTTKVVPSEFTADAGVGSRALVGLLETKDWLRGQGVQQVENIDDLEIVRVINDISDRFHQEAEREFKVSGTNPQTRTFIADPAGRRQPWYIDGDYVGDTNIWRRRLRVGDLSSFTQVQIVDTDWSTVLETVALAKVAALPTVRQSWEPITELEFQSDVTALSSGMRVAVTGAWGFPAVPGNVRQAVLDAVAATMDRDVEFYRQDLGARAAAAGRGTTVVMLGSRQRFVSMPPTSLAVAWSYRDLNIG